MIPLSLFKLPSELLHVYAAVRSFDWQKEGEDRSGCTASAKTIADRIGKGERQTRDNLAKLAACGAVRMERDKGEAFRILCTPEDFDPAKLTPAVHRRTPEPRQPRQSTAGGSGSPPPEGPAVHRRRVRQSTADEVKTLSIDNKYRQEVETLAGDPSPRQPTAGVLALFAEEPERKPKRTRKPATEKPPAVTAAVRDAYSAAYARRYNGHSPAMNARVYGQFSRLLSRIPMADAPAVAEFYVWHNDSFYSRKGHPVGLLLADAEKLHMEWATGQRINAAAARQREQSEACGFRQIIDEMEREERVEHVDSEVE